MHEWYALVRNDMVWHGMTSYGMAWHGWECDGIMWHGIAWYVIVRMICMVWHVRCVWYVRHGVIRNSTVQWDKVWQGLVWCV